MTDGKRFVVAMVTVLAILAIEALFPRMDLVYVTTGVRVAYATDTPAAQTVVSTAPTGVKIVEINMSAKAPVASNIIDQRQIKSQYESLGIVNPIDIGAIGNGVNDDTLLIQTAINYAIANNLTIRLPKTLAFFKITDSIKINGPLRVIFEGGVIRQTSWGKPGIEVRSADVTFEGECKIESIENRSVVTVATIAEAVGDTKASSSGVVLCNATDRFKAETINCSGFVAGLTLLGSVKKDIYIDKLIVDNVDFGLFGSGFDNLRIGSIHGKKIINSQGEPEHVVYITGTEEGYRNKSFIVGNVHADSIPGGKHVVSVKSTYGLSIGSITGNNIGAIFNAQWSKGIVDIIKATTNVITTDVIILSQNIDTDVMIASLDIATNSTNWIVASTTSAELTLMSPRIKHTNATPVHAIRNTAKLKVYNPTIEYANGQPENVYAFLSDGIAPAKLDIINPTVIGGTRVLYQNAANGAAYSLALNPNMITPAIDSVVISNGVYNTNFLAFQTSPYVLRDGTTTPSLCGANILKTANTAPRLITKFNYGSNGQEFILIAGDEYTYVQHNSDIILKGGVTKDPGTWKVLRFQYIEGKAYEV